MYVLVFKVSGIPVPHVVDDAFIVVFDVTTITVQDYQHFHFEVPLLGCNL